MQAGIDVRHISEDCNVPMYRTNRPCREAGRLKGELVVSMRPVPAHQVADAVTITARYPAVHGAPVHIGEPQALGIQDINKPDFGDPVTLRPRRNTSVLGLWRYPTGSSDGITGAICCKPCPRPHVYHRYSERRPGNNNKDVMCDFYLAACPVF